MVLLSKAIVHSFSQNKLQYEHACIFLITKLYYVLAIVGRV